MKHSLFLISILLLVNCKESKNIDIQGHRGCRGLLPENTIPAFIKAIELGVHTLELDLAISKDSVVVVSHEPFMSRTTCLDLNGKEIPEAFDKAYNLYQMTFDSIKQFDCGLKPHPRFPEQLKIEINKPSLEEVIVTSKSLNPDIKFNIEIKARPEYDDVFTPQPKAYVNLVLDVIKKNNVFNKVNLQCFDVRILEEIHQQAPTMRVALLIDEDEHIEEKLETLSFKPEIISPYYKLLDAKTVSHFQAIDFQVIPWTVNTEEAMQHMIDFQVDGMITDYPNRLINILK